MDNSLSPVAPSPSDHEYTLEKILPDDCVLTVLESRNYQDAIQELVRHLHRLGHVKDMSKCLDDIHLRERLASTILDKGLAFPHACSTQVTRLISTVALCRLNDGNQNALPSKPLVIILTLCPPDVTHPYIQYLAHMSSVLQKHPDLDDLRNLDDPQALRNIFLKE